MTLLRKNGDPRPRSVGFTKRLGRSSAEREWSVLLEARKKACRKTRGFSTS